MPVSATGDDHVESVRLCGCMASGIRRFHSEFKIAKNQNTFAKRQREQEKRQRADEKRKKRDQKKDGSFSPAPSEATRFLPKTVRNKILKTDLTEVGLFY